MYSSFYEVASGTIDIIHEFRQVSQMVTDGDQALAAIDQWVQPDTVDQRRLLTAITIFSGAQPNDFADDAMPRIGYVVSLLQRMAPAVQVPRGNTDADRVSQGNCIARYLAVVAGFVSDVLALASADDNPPDNLTYGQQMAVHATHILEIAAVEFRRLHNMAPDADLTPMQKRMVAARATQLIVDAVVARPDNVALRRLSTFTQPFVHRWTDVLRITVADVETVSDGLASFVNEVDARDRDSPLYWSLHYMIGVSLGDNANNPLLQALSERSLAKFSAHQRQAQPGVQPDAAPGPPAAANAPGALGPPAAPGLVPAPQHNAAQAVNADALGVHLSNMGEAIHYTVAEVDRINHVLRMFGQWATASIEEGMGVVRQLRQDVDWVGQWIQNLEGHIGHVGANTQVALDRTNMLRAGLDAVANATAQAAELAQRAQQNTRDLIDETQRLHHNAEVLRDQANQHAHAIGETRDMAAQAVGEVRDNLTEFAEGVRNALSLGIPSPGEVQNLIDNATTPMMTEMARIRRFVEAGLNTTQRGTALAIDSLQSELATAVGHFRATADVVDRMNKAVIDASTVAAESADRLSRLTRELGETQQRVAQTAAEQATSSRLQDDLTKASVRHDHVTAALADRLQEHATNVVILTDRLDKLTRTVAALAKADAGHQQAAAAFDIQQVEDHIMGKVSPDLRAIQAALAAQQAEMTRMQQQAAAAPAAPAGAPADLSPEDRVAISDALHMIIHPGGRTPWSDQVLHMGTDRNQRGPLSGWIPAQRAALAAHAYQRGWDMDDDDEEEDEDTEEEDSGEEEDDSASD